MPSDDVIRELCARAVDAEGEDFRIALDELHAALHAHVKSIRAMAAAALLNPPMPPPNLPEA